MKENHLENSQAFNFGSHKPALFSVDEEESHYLVAVDIPAIPSWAVQVLTTKEALQIEGILSESEGQQTIFQCRPQGKGIRASYKNGVLWLMLPKTVSQQAFCQAQQIA